MFCVFRTVSCSYLRMTQFVVVLIIVFVYKFEACNYYAMYTISWPRAGHRYPRLMSARQRAFNLHNPRVKSRHENCIRLTWTLVVNGDSETRPLLSYEQKFHTAFCSALINWASTIDVAGVNFVSELLTELASRIRWYFTLLRVNCLKNVLLYLSLLPRWR